MRIITFQKPYKTSLNREYKEGEKLPARNMTKPLLDELIENGTVTIEEKIQTFSKPKKQRATKKTTTKK